MNTIASLNAIGVSSLNVACSDDEKFDEKRKSIRLDVAVKDNFQATTKQVTKLLLRCFYRRKRR